MSIDNSKKNCVILYSRRHFNPGHVTDLDESSAARIAREVYESAVDTATHNVFYFDSFDHTEWVRMNVDILISLVDNRNLAIWFFKPKKSYIIAVNKHPASRLKLIHEAKKNDLPVNALTASDGILQSYRGLQSATEIACVGNDYVAESFREHLPSVRVTNTYYNSKFIDTKCDGKEKSQTDKKRILVLASSIGFRKGADLLIQLAKSCKDDPLIFEIVGYPELGFWKSKLFELAKENSNVVLHGWVNNKSAFFQDFLGDVDAAVFLSREEGLLGSLLECITKRIPSFHGIQSGLTPCQNEFDISHLNVERTKKQLQDFFNMPLESRINLTKNQKNVMLQQFNELEPIRAIVRRWLTSKDWKLSKSRHLSGISKQINPIWNFIKSYGYWRIYFMRLKILTIRFQLDKLFLRNPSFYAGLKNARDAFFR